MIIKTDEEYDKVVAELDKMIDDESDGYVIDVSKLNELFDAIEAYDNLHHNPPFGSGNKH
jgi:antitoxin component HigA of HigAB toxin-antitoxin module